MRETNREQIRRALDECLSGMDGRPSLEKRVLARAKGERRGPRRLSLALAVALLMLLLAAAALCLLLIALLVRLVQRFVDSRKLRKDTIFSHRKNKYKDGIGKRRNRKY